MLKLFDTVTLKNDDPETGVKAGTEGTIVDVLGNGKAFTVEFFDEDDFDEDDDTEFIEGVALAQKISTWDVALEGKGLFTPLGMKILNNEDNLKEFKKLAKVKKTVDDLEGSFSQEYIVSDRCITVIKEKHLKEIKTTEGTFTFRYKMAKLSRKLLEGREGRNLPF